jgi:hypothetical protein
MNKIGSAVSPLPKGFDPQEKKQPGMPELFCCM